MKFKRIGRVVDAIQFKKDMTKEELDNLFTFLGKQVTIDIDEFGHTILEKDDLRVAVFVNDYLIKDGESFIAYSCKDFESLYEKADDTFYDRLLTEKNELSVKVTKLTEFLAMPANLQLKMDPKQRELLNNQLYAMNSYLDCLSQRILLLA